MPVEGWRNSPHAAPAGAKFVLLGRALFEKSVRWIGDDGVNRARFVLGKPVKTVVLIERRTVVDKHRGRQRCHRRSLNIRELGKRVHALLNFLKHTRVVESQIRPN